MEEGTLQSFLESCQASYREIYQDAKPLHLVLGNESADLDSVASSILYAYLLTKKEQYKNFTILPLVNVQSNDIHLRTEVIAALHKFGISEQWLVYLDNINFLDIQKSRILSLTMVDHNSLSLGQEALAVNVTKIIDHHKDEGYFSEDENVCKVIEPVGSCCTLIASEIINNHTKLLKVFPIADLMLTTILGDTQNLSSEGGRATDFDREVCEELEEHATMHRDELYQFVTSAKFNITGLSSVDILRKDFKFISTNNNNILSGISSITMESDQFFARDDSVRTIMTYCTVQKLDFIMLMFLWTTGQVTKRELVIFSVTDALRNALGTHLINCTELAMMPSKTMNQLDAKSGKYFLSFEQGNLKASRKIVMPIVRDFLNSSSGENNCSLNSALVKPMNVEHKTDSKTDIEHTRLHDLAISYVKADGEEEVSIDVNNSFQGNNSAPMESTESSNSGQFKDEENIRKVEKEIELFENEKNSAVMKSVETRATYIRTQSELEFDRMLYGSTSSEATAVEDTDTDSMSVDRRESFIRKLIDEAYAADEIELNNTFGSVGEWDQEEGTRRTSGSGVNDAKTLIYIRDLSFDFDENPEVHGSDVFAPVFLAVTEEEDEDTEEEGDEEETTANSKSFLGNTKEIKTEKLGLRNMRKKAQSIENLCVVLGSSDTDIPSLRSRSKSDLPTKLRRKPVGKKQEKRMPKLRSFDDNFSTEFDGQKREWRQRAERLGRNFYSQEGGLDSEILENMSPSVRFRDDQFIVDRDSEVSNLPKGRLQIYDEDGDYVSERHHSFNTALVNKHKSVERLYFDDDEERAVPDGSSDDVYETTVTYRKPDSPHVRGLWNRFITVNVGIQQRIVDLELIEPYMKVISHGGHIFNGEKKQTVMVFTACYLPRKGINKYDIIMEQLFYYVIHTLDLLVEDDYIIVYFNSGIDTSGMPKRSWLRECYYMINRRLKKSLSSLLFVHPNFWLRALVKFYRPFISGKFYKKIKLINSLSELESQISTEYIFIPEEVRRADPEFLYWSRRL